MKLALVLSDIHGHVDKAAEIARRHAGIPYVFIAGDITNFGASEEAEQILCEIQTATGAGTRIFCIAGNCDPASVRTFLKEQGRDMEGKLHEFPEFFVAGCGGGLKRPISLTCYERSEDDLESVLHPILQGYRNTRTEKPLVILTHTPPHGTNADNRYGRHVGSSSFAMLLAEYIPSVWICGHIHESRCISREDDTLIVNPGPCAEGLYAVLSRGYPVNRGKELFSASLGVL